MNKSETRKFDHKKGDLRLRALHLWKSGEMISEIARELQCSRETIYRWIRVSEKRLSKDQERRRLLVDSATHWKIVEAYILLGKPSVRALSEALREVYGLKLSTPQLRRYLKKWNLDSFSPSSFAPLLIQRRKTS